MKQYRLKKDLPDIKAGSIFTKDSDSDWISYTDQHGKKSYPASVVLDSPDWFQSISQDTTEINELQDLPEDITDRTCIKAVHGRLNQLISSHNALYQRVAKLEKTRTIPFTLGTGGAGAGGDGNERR